MKRALYSAVFAIIAVCASIPFAACAQPEQPSETQSAPMQAGLQESADVQEPISEPGAQMRSGAEAALTALTQQPQPEPEALRVLFINVGKADAILLQYGGKNLLIDTGTEESAPQLLGALRFMGADAIDALFLTHTHKDHIGGVPALARNLPVARAYAPLYSENKKNGENRITLAAEEAGIPLTRLRVGDAVPFADGVSLDVLGPTAYNDADDNDNSLVLRFSVNGRTLLLTGDMQFAEEKTLLDAGAAVAADVLKVGNHGNPDATSDAFGAAVAPSIAVISTDTGEDADSANPRVYAALPDAAVYVTQDTALGVLLRIGPDGVMTLQNAAPVRAQAALALGTPDRDTQTVTIRNNGADVDLSAWMLQSERGGELYVFESGSELAAGETATVAAEGGAGDFIFAGEDAPWHKKKADTAVIYDRFGYEIARS